MAQRAHNYLRTYRRRVGLSQDDVSALLGSENGSMVARYELFTRAPSLEAALSYSVIFGVPPEELFAGLYEKVERRILRRAKKLSGELATAPNQRSLPERMAALKAIARPTLRK